MSGARCGRLRAAVSAYDNWYAVLARTPPADTHPSYPSQGKQTGSDTWRCKECQGWDYRGDKGAYGEGSHYTGIAGIRDLVGTDPNGIVENRRDESHGYTQEIVPDSELRQLALFVSLGQSDVDLYVDRASKQSRGNPQRRPLPDHLHRLPRFRRQDHQLLRRGQTGVRRYHCPRQSMGVHPQGPLRSASGPHDFTDRPTHGGHRRPSALRADTAHRVADKQLACTFGGEPG